MTRRLLVLAKAYNKGYTRKDGVFVKPFHDKRPSGKGKEAGKSAIGKIKSLFGWDDDDGSYAPSPGSYSKPKPKVYPNAIKHPGRKEGGGTMMINEPDKSTQADTWSDPLAVAVYAVGDSLMLPDELHGVELAPWVDHPDGDDWDYVEGQMEDLDEPPLHVGQGKQAASGVVIEEPDGRVWVISPTNHFGGYSNVFPKGKAEEELSLQANAIKEAYEESGLKVEITGLLGDFPRSTSVTRFYTARRVGGTPVDVGWETQAVKLVPKSEIYGLMDAKFDHPVIDALIGATE